MGYQFDREIARVDALIRIALMQRGRSGDHSVQEKAGGSEEMAEKLKPCPFCGGEAKLVRVRSGYRTSPETTIVDGWEVQCKKKCCRTLTFEDEIFHSDDGEIVIKKNGAKAAIDFWNGRDKRLSSE